MEYFPADYPNYWGAVHTFNGYLGFAPILDIQSVKVLAKNVQQVLDEQAFATDKHFGQELQSMSYGIAGSLGMVLISKLLGLSEVWREAAN